MVQKRLGGQKKNVSIVRKSAVKPSKREVCAHVWQFVHYVEDFMSNSKNYHKPTCRIKCAQVKALLTALED